MNFLDQNSLRSTNDHLTDFDETPLPLCGPILLCDHKWIWTTPNQALPLNQGAINKRLLSPSMDLVFFLLRLKNYNIECYITLCHP